FPKGCDKHCSAAACPNRAPANPACRAPGSDRRRGLRRLGYIAFDPGRGTSMRLADYIEQNAIAIVDAAEAFAETHRPDGVHLDREALRDHLPQILAAVVDDLRQSQSVGNELARAEGDRDTPPGHPSAAQTHG